MSLLVPGGGIADATKRGDLGLDHGKAVYNSASPANCLTAGLAHGHTLTCRSHSTVARLEPERKIAPGEARAARPQRIVLLNPSAMYSSGIEPFRFPFTSEGDEYIQHL